MHANSIRLREKLICSKDVLYEIRRPIPNKQKKCEMESPLNEIEKRNNWSYEILKGEDKKFCGCNILFFK